MSNHDKRDIQDASPPSAGLDDLLRLWRRNLELDLNVSAPGSVVSYDPTTQTAQVQLDLLRVKYDEETGAEVPLEPVIVPKVPVYWHGSSTGYVSTPLAPGDTGILVFADRCLSVWLETGGPVDPISGRTHSLADAFFLPGVRPRTKALPAPGTDLAATVVEGPPAAGVKLGRNAAQSAVLGELLQTALNTYAGAISAANTALATSAAGAGGIATVPAWNTWDAATTTAQTAFATQIAAALSLKVRIE